MCVHRQVHILELSRLNDTNDYHRVLCSTRLVLELPILSLLNFLNSNFPGTKKRPK